MFGDFYLMDAGNGFPDYSTAIKKLPVVAANHGIHLMALVDIPAVGDSPARRAGDEWQLCGPLTYIPRPEVVR